MSNDTMRPMADIRDTIKNDRQHFVDVPIVVNPVFQSAIGASVSKAFGQEDKRKPIVVAYRRTPLRWVKPGPDGTLVPQ